MTLNEIYESTRQGLDILIDLLPQVADSVSNLKKKFKIRDERTASAQLYAPNAKREYWYIVDYGETQKPMSPIDVYMREYNVTFEVALHELAQKYGVVETLDKRINRPRYEEFDVPEGISDDHRGWQAREGFTEAELRLWGPLVKPTNLTALGWSTVEYVEGVKNGKLWRIYSTETYPIFAQRCPYVDGDGNKQEFVKIYQPCNPDHNRRFMYQGKVQQSYIFGMAALAREYERRKSALDENAKPEDAKLDCVFIASGGRDAVNIMSMGGFAVCLNSETIDLREQDYYELLRYAKEVINVPDIDSTGQKIGRQLALRFPTMKTVWLPEEELQRYRDNRGHQYKDFTDWVRLHNNPKDFVALQFSAMKACFYYKEHTTKEKFEWKVSLVYLCYFLSLQGFARLKDDSGKDMRFVRLDGIIVEEVTLKDIQQFLKRWTETQQMGYKLKDAILRARDWKDNIATYLPVVDLDFSSGTPTSQFFYFLNSCVEVTADGIKRYKYQELADTGHYVWKHQIIQHNYEERPDMFDVAKLEDGCYDVAIQEHESELFEFIIQTSRHHWRKEDEQHQALTVEELRDHHQSLANKLFLIGYLLHNYKKDSRAWAGILFDSVNGNSDECNGRSGKSLFGKMLKHFMPSYVYIEAKSKDITTRQFIFANVTRSTNVIFIDECNQNLDYGFFFGKVTGDFPVENKGVDPYNIPFSESPKLLLASNYVIKQNDPSTWGRLLPAVFSDYYHMRSANNDYREDRSVHDSFDHDLFDSEYKGWQDDIAFILQCERFYLKSIGQNNERIMPPMHFINLRQQKAVVGVQFDEWADDYFQPSGGHLDCYLDKNSVINNYRTETGDNGLSIRTFTKKLKAYCDYTNLVYNPDDVEGKANDGRIKKRVSGNIIEYIFIRSINDDDKI